MHSGSATDTTVEGSAIVDASGTPFHNGPGKYVQTFTCTDHSNNVDEFARTFHIEDNTAPLITLVDTADKTIEADRDSEYTDTGATCSDYSDGQIDHQVVISGDVVNMRVPGTYTINFNCEDASGNSADTVSRTVVIQDTTCPYVRLFGKDTITVEAGFPYEDLGATATDTLDGDLTTLIEQTGTLSAAHFQTMRSCQEIAEKTGVAGTHTDGVYNIMVKISGDYHYQPVFCKFGATAADALTLLVVKTTTQTVPYGTDQGGCAAKGMVMPLQSFITANDAAFKSYAANIDGGNCNECFPTAGATTTDYFCVPAATTLDYANDQAYRNDDWTDHDKDKTHDQTRDTKATILSNVGTESTIAIASNADGSIKQYQITFHIKDHAGNGCGSTGCTDYCASFSQKSRTVHVKDTLPPVITLTLKNKLIQTSDGSQIGLNGVYNPAGRRDDSTHFHHSGVAHKELLVKGNPFLDGAGGDAPVDTTTAAQHSLARDQYAAVGRDLMAEQSSTNGWIIAAAASAVAGVALMGFSMKATTPITVPV